MPLSIMNHVIINVLQQPSNVSHIYGLPPMSKPSRPKCAMHLRITQKSDEPSTALDDDDDNVGHGRYHDGDDDDDNDADVIMTR